MAGAGFKTFNTGDVLTASDVNTYLMQQTVMVFADSSARTTALGANVAEGMISYLKDTNTTAYYDGSSWVTLSTGGDITEVTAGTGLTGGGTSGAVTLDFDVANYGGGQYAAGKNKVINGDCRIAQRGTAAITLSSTTGTHFPVDRFWVTGHSGATTQQQSSISLTGFNNAIRVSRTAGNTTTTDLSVVQSFESSISIPFQNKSVTLSFWARAGANFSPTSSTLTSRVYTGTGTDQGGFGFSWTGTANPINQANTLTTSWQRFTATGTISSTATQIQLFFFCTPTGTAGANDWFEITGIQLEQGSTATPFQTATGNPASELAACQRYYNRFSGGDSFAIYVTGTAGQTNTADFPMPLNVPMRVSPTALDYSNISVNDGATAITGGTLAIPSATNSPTTPMLRYTKTGLTQYRPYLLGNNAGAGYIGFSAEL